MADPDSANNTVNDVSPPSQRAADPTSRPIIVNHGPMMADPTIKPAEEAAETDNPSQEESVAAAHKNKIIEAPQNVPTDNNTDGTEVSKPSDPPPKATDSLPVDVKAEETKKAVDAKELAVTNLIESKKYFLPIREAKRKRRVRLITLLIAAAVIVGSLLYYRLMSS